MKKGAILLILGLAGFAFSLYRVVALGGIEDLVTSQSQMMFQIPDPYQLLQKVINSKVVNEINMSGVFEGDEQEIINNIRDIFDKRDYRAAMLLKVKQIFIVFPDGFVKDQSGTMQVAVLFDIGSFYRLLNSFFAIGFGLSDYKTAEYQGYRIYTSEKMAFCFIRGHIVFGTGRAVQGVIECVKGKRPAIKDALKIYDKGREAVDPNADATLFILSQMLLTPKTTLDKSPDPRWLLMPDAFEGGAVNLFLDPGAVFAKASIFQTPAKTILPYTKEKSGSFGTLKFMTGRPFAFLALKVERPASLTAPFMSLLSGKFKASNLRRKMYEVALSAFLQTCSDEAAIIMNAKEDKVPTFAVRVAQKDEAMELIDRLSNEAAGSLSAVTATPESAKAHIESALGIKLDMSAGLEKALKKLSDEKQIEAKKILDELSDYSGENIKEFIAGRAVSFMGTRFFYTFVDDYLLLSTDEKRLAEIEESSNSNSEERIPKEIKPFLDMQGSMLGLVNFGSSSFFSGENKNKTMSLGVSVRESSDRVTVKAAIPLDMGLAPPARPFLSSRLLVGAVGAVVYLPAMVFALIALIGLRRLIRSGKSRS